MDQGVLGIHEVILRLFRTLLACGLGVLMALPAGRAKAANLEVFHADSLAGPMEQLKAAFEKAHQGVTILLTSGRSQELAERILKGDRCDVFASSSPAVIEQDLMQKKIGNTGKVAASWFVVFSANEMVIIAAKGNPLGLKRIADLAKSEVKFARVTGEKDLATNRTIEFLKKAAALEGRPELAQKIIDGAAVDPGKPNTVPDTIRAVKEGKANAGVVYYSAAMAARNDLDIIRFPASVNQSDTIRNAATVPGTAEGPLGAIEFVRFLLSDEGRKILEDTGQPALVPAIRKGDVPVELR
ncbi:MAG TPA: extracellular solute-binding protein [Candidatus Methylomirabilis sp.]|nr:extracellular solute-binding protein [Candidatus Methylomirabilis sp.]